MPVSLLITIASIEDGEAKKIFSSETIFVSEEQQKFWISSRLCRLSIILVSLECVSFSKVLNIFSKFISPIKKTFLTEDEWSSLGL